jgi:hypothetical protein
VIGGTSAVLVLIVLAAFLLAAVRRVLKQAVTSLEDVKVGVPDRESLTDS